MSSAKRALTEIVVIAVLALAVVGVWWWKDRACAQALSEESEACRAELETLTSRAEYWADALAASEAEATFRAFSAGISPAVLSGRQDSVDLAVGQLLSLSGIDFVHVLAPDGAVLASSDRVFTSRGNAADRAAWALGADEVMVRTSADHDGVTEVAAPILGTDGPEAYLWIGYRTEERKDELRPAVFGPQQPESV